MYKSTKGVHPMKMYRYAIFFVFFGIVSTNVMGNENRSDMTKDNNTTRQNGISNEIENLIPRIYHPQPPVELESLKYYSPDSYCKFDSNMEFETLSQEKMIIIIDSCFTQHEKWLRLSQ